MQFIVWE
jgi:hypothetical protein